MVAGDESNDIFIISGGGNKRVLALPGGRCSRRWQVLITANGGQLGEGIVGLIIWKV